MPLEKYFKKRDFKKTPEPKGKIIKEGKKLIFVVHKHKASHLHYDFRLELEGVLESWAVPKGPTMDPGQKHLAIQVEEHPYEYRNFEGIIPKGNYGAGVVMIWDEGTYTIPDIKKTKQETEKIIKKNLKEGRLSFVLNGKKLKGEFALVKLEGRGKNNWLLIKARDKFAGTKIVKENFSVRSGKTIEEIESA